MDPVTNPYTPNAGAEPEILVGRDDQLQSFEVLLHRLSKGRTEQSMIITGLRGVGKTVLLNRFRAKALAASWIVIELEVRKHDEAGFRRELANRMRTALFELSPRARWTERLRFAAAVLQSFSVSADPQGAVSLAVEPSLAEGFGDHGELGLDVSDVLVAMGEAAQGLGRGVALLLDEVQFLDSAQLEALIQALHRVVQRKLPVTMVGAGLPQIAELAGDAKSYAERLLKFPVIGNLSVEDAAQALQGPALSEGATFTEAALERAYEVTGGYPYFIQELGYAVWRSAAGPTISSVDVDEALPLYEAKLDLSFFRVRLDRATDLERAYLRAMAELGPGPQRAADVAAVLGRTSNQAGPIRSNLIAMGLLYAPEHGYAGFTVPHFDAYLIRTMPELVVPPLRPSRRRASSPGLAGD